MPIDTSSKGRPVMFQPVHSLDYEELSLLYIILSMSNADGFGISFQLYIEWFNPGWEGDKEVSLMLSLNQCTTLAIRYICDPFLFIVRKTII